VGLDRTLPARETDRIFFEVAPPLLLVAAILAAAVLPLSPDLIVTDLATGALFVNAALAYVMVALVMAGWGPDGAYAMVGGWRFLGQLIGYSMPIVMVIVGVAMRAESLLTTRVVEAQAPLWNAIYQPGGFVVFFVAAMSLSFLPPFDLPTAPGELAGGVAAEYTGPRLAVFRLARAVLVVTLAAAGQPQGRLGDARALQHRYHPRHLLARAPHHARERRPRPRRSPPLTRCSTVAVNGPGANTGAFSLWLRFLPLLQVF
jgi:NADH-quinone oxidoreductase subunit H